MAAQSSSATPTAITTVVTQLLLGAAAPYALLAGTTITNSGASVVIGDLGLSPGTLVAGFESAVVYGVQNIANSAAASALAALTTTFNAAAALTPTNVAAGDLGGSTLTSGVYASSTSLVITGVLTLDGSPGDVFVFQMGSTLTTASASSVILTGGVLASNVYWVVRDVLCVCSKIDC